MRILKIKVGEIYFKEKGENLPVFLTAFEKIAKSGNPYFELKTPIFVSDLDLENANEQKELIEKVKANLDKAEKTSA